MNCKDNRFPRSQTNDWREAVIQNFNVLYMVLLASDLWKDQPILQVAAPRPTIVPFDAFAYARTHDDAAARKQNPRFANPLKRRGIMAHEQHGAPVSRDVMHFTQTFLLELGVADGENLVHDKNFRLQMGGDGEGQPDIHAAGVPLDRRIQEIFDLGEARRSRRISA